MSRRKLIFVATSAVVAMCLATANSAFADNGSSSDEAVSSVTKADPSLAEDAVKVSEENITGQSPLNVGDSQITLPKDAAKTIEVDSKDRSDISVSLPFAETAASAQVVADRVVYDNQNGSKTVPVPRGDGSMQINTVIESPSAPTAYPYTFSVPGTAEVREEGEIEIRYKGYIARQLQQVSRFKSMEEKRIPEDIDYAEVGNLRLEARQKLSLIRPDNVGMASRISGVSPADISVLLVHLEKRRRKG